MNQDQHQENHYRKLCEKLNEEIYLLEKMLKKKIKKIIKKKKLNKLDPVGKEDEDVDNDGKKNTSSDKYIKARREKISQEMKKKKMVNEGYAVTDGNIFYGGFPRVLNESGVVDEFNDADDTDPNDEQIATQPDAATLRRMLRLASPFADGGVNSKEEYNSLVDHAYGLQSAMNKMGPGGRTEEAITELRRAFDAFKNHPYHKIASGESAQIENLMRGGSTRKPGRLGVD